MTSTATKIFIRSLDVTGTFLFALGGAIAAITARLDLFGITVLAFATALGGGIIRDVLIGATPPAALSDWRYSATVFAAAPVGIFYALAFGNILPPSIAVIDAAGLSLFAVAGAQKALHYDLSSLVAVVLGLVSAVGGGTIRDVLLARVPSVLHADFYASAALAGAAVMVACRKLAVPAPWAAGFGGITCFSLRLSAIALHWSLPTIR